MDCEKLYMCMVRVSSYSGTPKCVYSKVTAKILYDEIQSNIKWNTKKYSIDLKESRKGGTEWKNRKETENKTQTSKITLAINGWNKQLTDRDCQDR